MLIVIHTIELTRNNKILTKRYTEKPLFPEPPLETERKPRKQMLNIRSYTRYRYLMHITEKKNILKNFCRFNELSCIH